MTGARLIQLSGVIVDMIYWIDAVPVAGAEATVHRHALAAGGGFNAMVAARRADLPVTYAASLGTGPFADIAARALADEGIGILRPQKTHLDQGCCTVLIDAQGERSFIAAEGADGVLTDADLALVRPAPEDWLLLSGYALGYENSREALSRWLRPGLPLVFDPSPLVGAIAAETLASALAAARWISANQAEAATLTGVSDAAEAAQRLADGRTGGGAVVRDGANGCYLAFEDQLTHVAGHPVCPVDTNGAGDAHIGAFIASLAFGDDPLTAARIANVTAALSTLKEGPSTAPTREEALSALLAAASVT